MAHGKVRTHSKLIIVLLAVVNTTPATYMPPFEDCSGVAGSRGWQKRRGHRKQLSSSSSLGSVSSLPEYRRSGRHTPNTSLSAIWDTEEDPSPPPDYSDPVTLVVEAPSSAEEADEESEDIMPSPRRRLVRHRRSYSLRSPSHKETNIDVILERSVNALEMSNALLQSSMSTRDTLSNVLAADDLDLDRSLESHAQYLSRRMVITQEQEAGMADIMRSVDSLLDEGGGISRSAPPTIGFHRQLEHAGFHTNDPPPSNLHPDTDPSHSSQSPDPIPTYLSNRSPTPIQSEPSEYHSPASTSSAPPTVTQRPFSPSTPAYHLLSSIVARSPHSPSNRGRRSNRISPLPSSNLKGIQGRDRGLLSASTSDLRSHASPQPGHCPRMIRRSRSSDDASAFKQTSPNTVAPFPKSSLMPIMTPRFFARPEKGGKASRAVVATKSVKILRQILANDAGASEIARGKQPAKDERVSDRLVTGGGRFLPRTAPVVTLALAGPSGSITKMVPLDVTPPLVPPSLPQSAMRGRFPSPGSSGRSSPRNVSFSALPPKGTRTVSAEKKYARKTKSEHTTKGWLTDWFSGDLPTSGSTRTSFARDQLEGWMV